MELYKIANGNIIKYSVVRAILLDMDMDNEPQGQAGKRVVDSFSLKIALVAL